MERREKLFEREREFRRWDACSKHSRLWRREPKSSYNASVFPSRRTPKSLGRGCFLTYVMQKAKCDRDELETKEVISVGHRGLAVSPHSTTTLPSAIAEKFSDNFPRSPFGTFGGSAGKIAA